MTARPPSGTQHTLRSGPYEAVIASVGATLRSLRHHQRDLIVPFAIDEIRPLYRGATLVPWPNRIVDGRYGHRGVVHQLPLTEPERGHALHGLMAWTQFDAADEGPSHVSLRAVVEPQTGYPFRLAVTTTFSLVPEGLRQTVSTTNLSDDHAPWGTAPHPYLRAGDGHVDDWQLELPAERVLAVDTRLAPLAVEPVGVDAARFDFRERRRIAATELDHAFTGLRRGSDGTATVRVTTPAGTGVAISFDRRCRWVQVHTADRPLGAADAAHRIGLAVEPMTCPPDAFNSGVDLVLLRPGQTVDASWTISAVGR